ncbi:Hypothetical predicted protein, partial [Pelobates cultripes]
MEQSHMCVVKGAKQHLTFGELVEKAASDMTVRVRNRSRCISVNKLLNQHQMFVESYYYHLYHTKCDCYIDARSNENLINSFPTVDIP